MSMAADIVTLELIAAVHQVTEVDQTTYDHLVHRLQNQVAHFDWVGIYLLDSLNEYDLKASSGDQMPESIARKAILQVPITSSCEEVLGRITVTSKTAIAFDESDYTSLEALAYEIGKKVEQSLKNHQ
ncbi:hypothetical protein [Ammoniphilus sp. CFH 90114]|uniref:hypothetical protein n=1 Tax=Ammoniphilus sp. CFH 90114 TaxID=2493665 RepID=UPI00100FB645|nr:hypothetical protein [Ammoniphilus sp. CFH 90114]RXT04907.1 hypothetical protein EIZ39_19490 [Ammoniphilus sp. CFH 90114]